MPSIAGLATSSSLTAAENKVPSISGLATISALTAVENKIPSISSLVKKKQIMIQKLEELKIELTSKIK